MLKMDNQQGPTVQPRDSAPCYMAAWLGAGGEWIHICLQLSPFAVHLQLSQHCSSAIPHYKFKRKKKMMEAVIPPGEPTPNTQGCSKDPYILSSELSELLSMVSWRHGGWCLN